jgi:phage-related protein
MANVEFYRDKNGVEPVDDYFTALAERGEASRVASLAHRIEVMEEQGYPLPGDVLIDRGARLWEMHLGPHRVAYAQSADVIWLLHAWRKRSRKLDEREARTARRRLADIE